MSEALDYIKSVVNEEEKEWTSPGGSNLKQTSRSEEQKNLFSALVKAQSQMAGAKKGAINPHFQSKYADLAAVWDAIRTPLTENGLCLLQEPQPCETGILLETTLAHESGEWRSSTAYFPVDAGKINNPQAMMSTLTYIRRGSAMAIVGIAPEDDDGNAGVTSKTPPPDEKALAHQKAVRDHLASVLQIQESLAVDDYETAAQAYYELDEETQRGLNLAPTKGGIFTTAERSKMKSDEWGAARKVFSGASATGDPE